MEISILCESLLSRSTPTNNTNSKKKSSAGRIISRYGIGGSDEDNQSDADNGGTKSFPSRTFIGSKSAFGEKHGWALKPLILFWGLIVIPEYYYRYKLSVAKRQIMALDIPRVEYEKTKAEPKSKTDILSHNSTDIKTAMLNVSERRDTQQWEKKNLSDL